MTTDTTDLRAQHRKVVQDLLVDGELLLLSVIQEDKEVVGVVNPLFGDPGTFGIVLADMVTHVVAAYAEASLDPIRVRQSILAALGAELDFPTNTTTSVQKACNDIPQA